VNKRGRERERERETERERERTIEKERERGREGESEREGQRGREGPKEREHACAHEKSFLSHYFSPPPPSLSFTNNCCYSSLSLGKRGVYRKKPSTPGGFPIYDVSWYKFFEGGPLTHGS